MKSSGVKQVMSAKLEMGGSKRMQYLAGSLASLSMFINGCFVGWASPTKIKMDNNEAPFTCSEAQWGWIVATISIGSVLGSLTGGKIADYIGRRNTLLCLVPVYLCSWIVTYFAYECYLLYIARLAAGYGLGVSFGICPVYIAEITEPSIRGRVCIFMTIVNNLGVVYSLSLGPYVSYQTYTLISTAFPVLFGITFYFMDETPFYRLKQGNQKAAMALLLKFRGYQDEKFVEDELDKMQRAVESEMLNKSTFRELVGNSINRRALTIVLGIKIAQYLSGATAIQSYLQTIFKQTDSPIPSEISGISCGLMQLVAGVLSFSIIDRFGRKPLLLSSTFGTFLTLLAAGVYYYLLSADVDVSSISWLPFASIMAFMVIQTCGLGSIPPLLLGEMFPTNLKAVAVTAATTTASITAFISIQIFSYVSTAFGMFAVFWLCSFFMVLSCIFIAYFVLETNGRSLMEIQEDLSNKMKKVENQAI